MNPNNVSSCMSQTPRCMLVCVQHFANPVNNADREHQSNSKTPVCVLSLQIPVCPACAPSRSLSPPSLLLRLLNDKPDRLVRDPSHLLQSLVADICVRIVSHSLLPASISCFVYVVHDGFLLHAKHGDEAVERGTVCDREIGRLEIVVRLAVRQCVCWGAFWEEMNGDTRDVRIKVREAWLGPRCLRGRLRLLLLLFLDLGRRRNTEARSRSRPVHNRHLRLKYRELVNDLRLRYRHWIGHWSELDSVGRRRNSCEGRVFNGLAVAVFCPPSVRNAVGHGLSALYKEKLMVGCLYRSMVLGV